MAADSVASALQDLDGATTELRDSIWRDYGSFAALGPDERGRTFAQNLNDWVMTDEARGRLRQLRAEAARHTKAGDKRGAQAAVDNAQTVLQEQQRRLTLIELYWSQKMLLDIQRALWARWVEQAPASDASVSRSRLQASETELLRDFSVAMTREMLAQKTASLIAAYNEERLKLARLVSAQTIAAGGAISGRGRSLPCPEPAPAADAKHDADNTVDRPLRIIHDPSVSDFYPLQARKYGSSGPVMLRLAIDATGCMVRADVLRSSGDPALDEAAIEVAQYTRYAPKIQGGWPVASEVGRVINFTLGAVPATDAASQMASSAQALIKQGAALLDDGKFDPAIEDFDKAIKLNPRADLALANRGIAYYWERKFDQARQDFDAAAAINPNNVVVARGRGALALEANQFAEAIDDFNRSLKSEPDNRFAIMRRAESYFRSGEREMALSAAQILIHMYPDSDWPYLFQSRYRSSDDLSGRRSDVDAALKADPRSGSAFRLLAQLPSGPEQATRDLSLLSVAVADHGDNVVLLTSRGIVYAKNAQLKLARQDFAAAIAGAKRANDHNGICWDLAIAGMELAAALQECDAALLMEPGDSAYQDSRGLVLLRLGRYEQSIAAYDAALKGRPGSAESLYGRGLAKRAQGLVNDAQADINSAIAANAFVAETYGSYGLKP